MSSIGFASERDGNTEQAETDKDSEPSALDFEECGDCRTPEDSALKLGEVKRCDSVDQPFCTSE